MKRILLTQGKYAIVDDEDYDWLMQWKWCAHKQPDGAYYAQRRRSLSEGPGVIYMHQQIAMTPPGMHTDHVNHTTLDNRRSNLHTATVSENLLNRKAPPCHNTSGYIGVSWHKKAKKWSAVIGYKYEYYYLGLFDDAAEAAHVRDGKAIELHGDFAVLNFNRKEKL